MDNSSNQEDSSTDSLLELEQEISSSDGDKSSEVSFGNSADSE